MLVATLVEWAAVVVSAAAAIIDHRTGRIPNWLTLPILPTAVFMHALAPGWFGAVESLAGLLLAGVVPWMMHRKTRGRAIGGGDVKLFAALGALLGPSLGLEIELTAFLLLGLMALVQLAFQGRLCASMGRSARLLVNPLLPARWKRSVDAHQLTTLRMGPAIFIAVVQGVASSHLKAWVSWSA